MLSVIKLSQTHCTQKYRMLNYEHKRKSKDPLKSIYACIVSVVAERRQYCFHYVSMRLWGVLLHSIGVHRT